jgi:hypothetical protein
VGAPVSLVMTETLDDAFALAVGALDRRDPAS